ncbi:MAG: hypothetical protein ISR77_28790 [Pirellulaceae bacterium]|nr:hypothetical protein [Pirellulaceae bacterium]
MRLIVTLAILLVSAGQLAAQNPFAPAGGGQPPGPGAGQPADPFGVGKPAAKPKLPVGKPQQGVLPPIEDEKDPVVLTIRESNPTTADELLFAVETLAKMVRPAETKFYLQKLIDLNLDRKGLVALHQESGSAFFYRISRDEVLKPEGERFGKAVLKAAYEESRDPARIRALVKQLSDPSFATRRQAVEALTGIGTAAVPAFLEAMADPNRAGEHPQVREAVVGLGRPLIDPMLGALESPDEGLRVQVMTVLGQFEKPQAVKLLVGPYLSGDSSPAIRQAAGQAIVRIVGEAPTRHDVEQYLYRRAKAYYEGELPGRPDHEYRVKMWRWDQKQKTSVPRRYIAADASLLMAARLANDLHKVAPDNVDFRRLFLLANLDFAKIDAGLEYPLPKDEDSAYGSASAAGVEAVEDVLAYAIEHGHVVAAIAAAEVLGDLGDVNLVFSDDGKPRSLASALRHGDRRLRMAAANAIMKFDPKRPYPGSSHLPEALGYVIRTVGSRRALIVHPRIEKSQTLVGMLNQIGFEADPARTGREAFLMAAKNPDYGFMLVSDGINYPDANKTIQMFRRDPRTSRLAIGLMAREERIKWAERIAELDPLVNSFPRPHNASLMAFQTSQLLDLAGRELVGDQERVEQAAAALDYLTRMAENREDYAFYDVYRQQDAIQSAFFAPELSAKAARLMGLLGSSQAQLALVTLASQHARPLAERKAAAQGFELAVQRRGLLLTRDDIRLQYDRYNQSETLDAGTQQVLAHILDAIEAPSKKKSQQQAQDSQPSQPNDA